MGARPASARPGAHFLPAALMVLSLGTALAPALPGALRAQAAGGGGAAAVAPRMPVLTINQERLFLESLFGERVLEQRDEASTMLAAENRRIEAELSAEEKALTEKRKTLPPETFRELADAFDRKVQTIRQQQDAKARAIAQQVEAEQQRFFELVLPILQEIVQQRGASAIIDRRAILVASDEIDITTEALQRINAEIGDGTGP